MGAQRSHCTLPVKLVRGTEQQYAKVNARRLRGEATMKEPSVASRLRSALQQRFDVALHEPLPKRWVNLIHELNEQERKDIQARQTKVPRRHERQ